MPQLGYQNFSPDFYVLHFFHHAIIFLFLYLENAVKLNAQQTSFPFAPHPDTVLLTHFKVLIYYVQKDQSLFSDPFVSPFNWYVSGIYLNWWWDIWNF